MKKLLLFWMLMAFIACSILIGRIKIEHHQSQHHQALRNLACHMVRNWSEVAPLMQTIEIKPDGESFGQQIYLATGRVVGQMDFVLRFNVESQLPVSLVVGETVVFHCK